MRNRILITSGLGCHGERIMVELASNPEWIVRLCSHRIQTAHFCQAGERDSGRSRNVHEELRAKFVAPRKGLA